MWGHPGDRIAADQWGAAGAGDVVLDRLSIHGPGNLLFKCRHDRLETGYLAPGRHTGFKPECRLHYPHAYAKRMAGTADLKDA